MKKSDALPPTEFKSAIFYKRSEILYQVCIVLAADYLRRTRSRVFVQGAL